MLDGFPVNTSKAQSADMQQKFKTKEKRAENYQFQKFVKIHDIPLTCPVARSLSLSLSQAALTQTH